MNLVNTPYDDVFRTLLNDCSSLLVRFFEYDTQIALDEGEIKKNVLTVTLPNSAALYLRCNAATPDEMIVEIITPGGMVSYGIPIMKSQSYSIDDIFEKKLLMLVPFHIFSYESRFKEYDRDKEKIEELQRKYRDIADRL